MSIEYLKSIATPLVRMETIASDPTKMIPVKYGQTIHLGYEHIDEEEAFLLARKKTQHFAGFNKNTKFRILRENTTAERLVQLCHKFNCLNRGIDVIVPKDEFLNEMQKCIFKCTLIYHSHIESHSSAKIHIEITAVSSPTFDLDEYVIWTNRLNGSSNAHYELFDRLKKYIELDGDMDPRINRPLPPHLISSIKPRKMYTDIDLESDDDYKDKNPSMITCAKITFLNK
jgi:hypothetical protein